MEIRFRYFPAFACALLSVCAAFGQAPPPAMRGTIAGFAFDPAMRGLRPILGNPGASTMGELVLAGADLERAAVSAEGDYALATTPGQRRPIAVLQLSGKISVRPLGDDSVDAIQLSPLGRFAVMYSSTAQTLQVVKGLPGIPNLGARLELAQIGGTPSAIAISDFGTVLAAAAAGDASHVFVFQKDGSARLISTVGHASALAFINGLEAVVADDRENKVSLLRFVTGVTATLPLAGPEQGLARPSALAVSRDQRRVVVANAGSAEVVDIALADGASARYACHCSPSVVSRMSGQAVFRITESADGPTWLFDGDALQPRIVFVPAKPVSGSPAAQ